MLAAATALAKRAPIMLDHLPEAIRTAAESPPIGPSRRSTASPKPLAPGDRDLKQRLEQLLQTHGDNFAEVARALGKDRKQIYRWMDRFGLRRERDS